MSIKQNHKSMKTCFVPLKRLSVYIGVLAFVYSANAFAIFGVGNASLQQFCEKPSVRQTVIYVDARTAEKEHIRWAKQLINKLRANLAPHERVTIISLNTGKATTSKIDSFCFPALWPGEPRQEGGWFSKSTEDKLELAKKQFRARMGAALEKAITKDYKSDADERTIVQALSGDTARLAKPGVVNRVFIYSDFHESSDLAKLKQGHMSETGSSVAAKIHANFHEALVYGIRPGGALEASQKTVVKDFFESFFRHSNAHLISLSSNVALSGNPPTGPSFWLRLVGKWKGQSIPGHAVLLTDKRGRLQDSYVDFGRQGSAPLKGTLRCNQSGQCKLRSKTLSPTLTGSSGETFNLTIADQIKGIIGFPSGETPSGRKPVVKIQGKSIQKPAFNRGK